MHPNTNRSWHLGQCAKAKSFSDLSKVALEELKKFGQSGAHMVCGPISTGGRGSVEENLEVFNKVIVYKKRKMQIFDQCPYEDAVIRLRNDWRTKDSGRKNKYCWSVLHDFYAPLFESGLIAGGIFIYGWESSKGAKWEHRKLRTMGKEISYVSEDALEDILLSLT